MRKVCGGADMCALGGSVARVVQLASSDDQGPDILAYYVLSDVALTQRILRLSNTACFHNLSATSVTTVSRAISLLGFDNVKTTALGMLLVDALSSASHAASVRIELEASLCASLVARELARLNPQRGAEEAAIAALFANLGPLLVATHEHERYREIAALAAGGRYSLAQASQMILGCSYESLAEAVLSEWQIPEVIVRALAPPAAGQKAAQGRAEWTRQSVRFAADAARLMARTSAPAAGAEVDALLARFGKPLGIDAEQIGMVFAKVGAEMENLLQSMSMQPLPKTPAPAAAAAAAAAAAEAEGEAGFGLPSELLLATLDTGGGAIEANHPSGKPVNARALLLAGVQEVTQMRASGQARVNELILATLETLYRSMGFRFATVCLKDVRNEQFRARVALGEDHARRKEGFAFPIAPSRDLFHLAMQNDADLMISDAGTPKIAELLPAWHRALLPDARSFIVLPLVLGKVQLGLFYADRVHTAPEGVPPDESALIKALKAQVLVALMP
ncbi:HDOD domain-containing protein [Massilia glaciei]|uniref:HDOD domain-containing protein n=2 Tax=Massilia glaciei TaxID=1524097 RepID=A0A2U2HPE5_9BURK|nr:HDOD domain-containing protein [Massilia glaciei]